MSWHNIKQRLSSWALTLPVFTKVREIFSPHSASGIRRIQFLRAGGILFLILVCLYGAAFFFFKSSTSEKQEETPQRAPTLIETPSAKIETDEVWRYKMEEENKKLLAKITAVETLFQEGVKNQDQTQPTTQDLEDKVSSLETQLEEKLETLLSQKGYSQEAKSLQESPSSQTSQDNNNQPEKTIQKFTLGLTESHQQKHLKTVETTIPAGAFARTVLLSGLDASSAMNASSDPRPMLLRLIDHGTLPRRFQSDLKDCHCLASAYGDLSSERIYARLEKLTCIERATGEIIETQVAGYIAGSDGKAGIRGIVASKDGQFLGRSLVGGIFSGLSNVANPQNRQGFGNPFFPGSFAAGGAQPSPPSIAETFTSGMASGVSTALDRLSQYYIDRAEQLQPVIQVMAGQVVDIVFTEGTFIGAQDVHADIRKQRIEASIAENSVAEHRDQNEQN